MEKIRELPHFNPWIGKNYNEQEFKIFILGESFINNGKSETMEKREENRNRVTEIIEEVMSGKTKAKNKTHNNVFYSYNNMFRMLYDKHTKEELKPLLKNWDNYSFANFFQKYVANKKVEGVHTKHIEKSDIEIARESLKKYLEILSPDLTIVWGKSKMKEKWFPSSEKEHIFNNLYKYSFNDKKYYIWFIAHPSTIAFNAYKKTLHKNLNEIRKYIEENKI